MRRAQLAREQRIARIRKGIDVEIRIGIANTGRELTFDSSESADTVQKSVAAALDAGATHVTFADAKGNSYIVPTASLAFVEIGSDQTRRVGFVA